MLEIDILRNSSQNNLGVLRGAFKGLGFQLLPHDWKEGNENDEMIR